jgi:CMP-N-acetylneuraminic acid synthetase
MKQHTEVLAIIPARGGSKGIPHKNIADVGGIPLMAYSIHQALHCPLITRTVVSTDCPVIAEIARQWGAETPTLRSKELSDDKADPHLVLLHILEYLHLHEGYSPMVVCTLFPTHPFRSQTLLRQCVEKCLQGYAEVRVVKPCGKENNMVFQVDENNCLAPVAGYRPGPERLLSPLGIFVGMHLRPWRDMFLFVTQTPWESVDVDEANDLALARRVVAQNLYTLPG